MKYDVPISMICLGKSFYFNIHFFYILSTNSIINKTSFKLAGNPCHQTQFHSCMMINYKHSYSDKPDDPDGPQPNVLGLSKFDLISRFVFSHFQFLSVPISTCVLLGT